MPKLTLCLDITGRKIELARVVKKLGNGVLETDGRSEDVTQTAVCCVMELMAQHCKSEKRESITYEIPGMGSLTYMSMKGQGGAEDAGN